jgi:hypothetical protein
VNSSHELFFNFLSHNLIKVFDRKKPKFAIIADDNDEVVDILIILKINREFGGTFGLHFQSLRISKAGKHREPDSKKSKLYLLPSSCSFLDWVFEIETKAKYFFESS